MNRSAPADGYDFGQKRQYRRNVWAQFRRYVKSRGLQTGYVDALLMPSAEGDEIEVALNAGFKEERLHVVDKNAAIVAHLKRRYRRINTYGTTLALTGERILKSGRRIDVANFDLCSHVGNTHWNQLQPFVNSGALSDRACVTVTALRGREKDPMILAPKTTMACRRLLRLPDSISDNECGRIGCCIGPFIGGRYAPRVFRADSYKSQAGNQTILWVGIELVPRQSEVVVAQ